MPTFDSSTYFATGCYDNAARLWDASGTCMMTMGGHGGAVKAVKMFSAASQPQSPSASILHCITASQDQTARVWQCDVEKGLSTAIMEMRGHEGSVDGVDVRGMQVVVSAWACCVFVSLQ